MGRHIRQVILLNLTLSNGLQLKVLKNSNTQTYLFFNNLKELK